MFRAVCEAHLDFVWRFVASRGVDPHAVETVVQKVFGVLHGRLVSLEDPSELRVAVARIARSVVRNYRYQVGQHVTLEPASVEGEVKLQIELIEGIADKSARELCDLILTKMSEPEREVFVLCDLEEFSLFEAAEALHIGEATLRSRLDDARRVFNAVSAELRAQQFWTSRAGSEPP